MNTTGHPWALVIFACRESLPQLRQTLDAALVSASACAVIHVLVNGNPALAHALADGQTRRPAHSDHSNGDPDRPSHMAQRPAVHIWSIPLADKANAWNQYIHQIWAGETLAFFIDGYVRLNADAIALLGSAVEANAQALGGTGVPTMGRSAKALRENMIINTGFHGNFCCIKGDTLGRMRDEKIRLPVGLYRTDGLMGALLCFGLDPGRHGWEDFRIHVHPTASWQIDPARWWRPQDVLAHLKRTFRQTRGKLENAAFADHLANRQCTPAALPDTAQAMVLEWVSRCPEDANRLAQGSWLMKPALAALRPASLPPAASLAPMLVWPHAAPTDH